MDKKTKNILIVISVVMILIAVVIVISKLIAPTTSSNNINLKFEDKTINDLRFSNINIVGNELTAYVQNIASKKSDIKTITVKFIDKENNEIDSVDVYFGGVFASNEIRNLDVKTDTDLSNLGDISYTINPSSCVVTRNSNRINDWGHNFYFTGYYQCDNGTGYINKCTATGKLYGYRNNRGLVGIINISNALVNNYAICTRKYMKTYSDYLFLYGPHSSFQDVGGGLPSTIDCSCGD